MIFSNLFHLGSVTSDNLVVKNLFKYGIIDLLFGIPAALFVMLHIEAEKFIPYLQVFQPPDVTYMHAKKHIIWLRTKLDAKVPAFYIDRKSVPDQYFELQLN